MAQATAPAVDPALLAKINAIEHEMNEVVIDQPVLVRELLLAVLSRGHFLALGEAGIAKTFTVDVFLSHVTGDVHKFYAMCFKAMDHQVLIGNLSPKRLIEDDVLAYNITDKLPEAHIAVLDEIFKNNAVNLNMLLPILNERRFVTNGHVHICPLWTCVGTSNLDEYHVTGELAAFSDRFGARMLVEPVSTDDGFRRILDGQTARFSQSISLPPAPTTIDESDVIALQDAVRHIVHPNSVMEAIVSLRNRAQTEGLNPSARRYGQLLQRMAAQAVLNGRSETLPTDLTLAQHSIWTDLEDRATAYKLIVDYAGAAVSKAHSMRTKLLDPLVTSLNALNGAIDEDDLTGDQSKELVRLNSEAKKITNMVDEALKEAANTQEDTTDLSAVKRELEQATRTIREYLGV